MQHVGLAHEWHGYPVSWPEVPPAIRASWRDAGTVKLVEGQNLTLHTIEDRQPDRVHWYLLPLLEWLAETLTAPYQTWH